MCREEEGEDAQMDRPPPPISATNHRNLSDHRNNNRTAADYYVLFLLSRVAPIQSVPLRLRETQNL